MPLAAREAWRGAQGGPLAGADQSCADGGMITHVTDGLGDTAFQMSPEVFMRMFGPEAQMEQQAHFSIQMVTALPALIAAGDLQPFAQIACLEAFFINVRLMADFLVRTTDRRDFGAATLVPDWSPAPANAAYRLRTRWWPLASQLVAHFSMGRIQGDPSEPVEFVGSAEDLEAMRSDVLAVWGVWRKRRMAMSGHDSPQ